MSYNKQGSTPPAVLVADAPTPAALGTNKRFAAAPNISGFDADKRRRMIRDRYALQFEARRLLPGHGIWTCLRFPVPGAPFVEMSYQPEYQRGRFHKLRLCSSPWVCPVCGAIITEKRRLELRTLCAAARAQGLRVLLVTLTFRHDETQPLRPMVDHLNRALRRLTGSRAYRALRQACGVVGWVRSSEVTRGRNGWHPHCHLLVFLPVEEDAAAFGQQFAALWLQALRSEGLDANEHGCRVDDTNEAVAEYVAKWGHERSWDEAAELTKWHVKRANDGKGMTPWDLLRASAVGDLDAGRLFREYAEAFKGRHQLQATPGLYAIFGLREQTDAELVEDGEAASVLLAWVRSAFWPAVVGQDALPDLQEAMDSGEASEVAAVLECLGLPVGSYGIGRGLDD